jgi:hypothetical protein
MVSNVAGTLTTVKGNVDQLKTYVLGTLETDVTTLTANAGVQAGNIATLTSSVSANSANIAVLQGNIVTLTANAASQANDITTLQGNIVTLTANAASQANDISALYSNASVQTGALATLTANALTQTGLIANITNGTATFGNIVPSANVTYNLGSETAQWKDLYLSGTTIYFGGAVLSSDGAAISTSATLAPYGLSVAGQPSQFEGIDIHQPYWDSGNSLAWGTAALYISTEDGPWGHNGSLIVETNNPDGNGIIPSNPDMYTLGTIDFPWKTVYSGNLEVQTINSANVNSIVGTIGNVEFVGGSRMLSIDTAGLGNYLDLSTGTGDVVLSTFGTSNVRINTDNDGIDNTWEFGFAGNLTYPNGTVQTTAYTATLANATPSTSTSTGTKGDIVYDASYIYICVATNQWIRALRAAW